MVSIAAVLIRLRLSPLQINDKLLQASAMPTARLCTHETLLLTRVHMLHALWHGDVCKGMLLFVFVRAQGAGVPGFESS